MKTPFHLDGKTVLVTGASSGIGTQSAISCAEMGAKVILTGRDGGRLESALSKMSGDGHYAERCDLLDEVAIASMVKRLPMLDGVVHCAGLVKPFPVQFLSSRKVDETMHGNFYSAVNLTAALFKSRKVNDGASLVFLSSISAQFPGKGNAMYAASKAGLEAFAKAVAAEYVHKKIRANCISPAMVKTPMYDYSSEGALKELMDKHVAQYPLGVGYPEDVANAVIYLLSPAARWVTGANIYMDGGFIFSQ